MSQSGKELTTHAPASIHPPRRTLRARRAADDAGEAFAKRVLARENAGGHVAVAAFGSSI